LRQARGSLGLTGFGAGAIVDVILLTVIREGLAQAESLTAILAFLGALAAWLVRVIRRAPERGSQRDSTGVKDEGNPRTPGAHAQRPKPAGNAERALAACAGCAVA
jgi:hypothetical protein